MNSASASRIIAAAALVFACATGSAFAQAEKGDKEVKIAGSVSVTNVSQGSVSETSTTGTFNFGLGVFVTNGFEVGFQPGFTITTAGSGTARETLTSPSIGFYGRQHFGRGKVAPYVGGFINVINQKQSSSKSETLSYGGGEFGLKNYLSEKTALDLNLSVGGNLNKPPSFGDATLINTIFAIGITHLF